MELDEVLRRRRMVRAYDPSRPVPDLRSTPCWPPPLRAPSAGFTQGTSLLVLTGAEDRAAYWAATADPRPTTVGCAGMRTAPVLILVWTSQAGLPGPLRRAGQGLDRSRSGSLVGARTGTSTPGWRRWRRC